MSSQPAKQIVLVTGGTGLVGSALRHTIETEPVGSRFGRLEGEEWVFLSSKDGDLKDPAAVDAIFKKYQPTHVIHLAALVGGLFKNMRLKLTFLRDNLLINDNVLEGSHQAKVQKLVSCLSTCVFPDKVEYPLDETKVHLGPPHESNFGYAHGKRLVDVQNHAYNDQFGSNFTSVIPTNIFGPGDNYTIGDAHVIPELMHKALLAKKAGTPFTVFGSGSPLRQFIYSRDLAKLFVWTLREYDEIDPVILSVGEDEEISIKDVATAIAKHIGYSGGLEFDSTKADGQHRKPASNAKLLKLINSKGGEPFRFTPFEEAMEESVKWFLDNYETARTGNPTKAK